MEAEGTGLLAPRDGVHVTGYFGREMGLGVVARGYVRALGRLGIPVALHDLSHHKRTDSRPMRIGNKAFGTDRRFAMNLVCVNAREHYQVVPELGEEHFLHHDTVGIWAWELPTFPAEWHDRFAWYDEIWVGSSFVANALAPVSPIPIVRIPPVVEPLAPGSRASGRARLRVADDELVFLFVFSFHSIFERKNPLAVIDAFKRAFSPAEPARLVIKCVNEDFSPDSFGRMQAMAQKHRISIHTGYWKPGLMRDVMAACDAYVSLHRSEGFGLTMAEAMAVGKPVIATAWSGNTDFMNDANSFPVNYTLVNLKRDFEPYRAGETWAEPSVEHAAQLMRRVFEDRDEARARGLAAKAEIAANYSTEQVAQLVQKRLAIIRQRRDMRPSQAEIGGPRQMPWGLHEAVRTHEPLDVVLYVVGGSGPSGNPALRKFPLINRTKGEPREAHAARVAQLVAEAMGAGGTHLVVPREQADWLGNHPHVTDYLTTNHVLAEASAETGIVFRLLPPGSVAVNYEVGKKAGGKKAKNIRTVSSRVDRLEKHVDRLQARLQQSQVDSVALAEKLAGIQPIVDSVPAIARAVAQVTRVAEELEQRTTQHQHNASQAKTPPDPALLVKRLHGEIRQRTGEG